MKKLKVAVYAICKNEEAFIPRWVESMKEADEIYVLDTGSTDNSVSLLKQLGVNVKVKTYNPWRFEKARNDSLAMVKNDVDICVCTDLDEVFDKGWRDVLEAYWLKESPTRARYNYYWKLNEKDEALVSFWINKIHTRKNYFWKHPVHEVLNSSAEEKIIDVPIVLKHYPDKYKSRQSYLPLLELSVKEDPLDDRNLHYLGREYMYYQKYDLCIDTLHKHLNCKKATWKDERCASMRFIARSYMAKGYLQEAYDWYKRAINEAPYLREAYIELANLNIYQNNFLEAYHNLQKAFKIKEKSKSYINEEFAWNDKIYDMMSIASFYSGHYKASLKAVKKAIKLNNKEPRYQENLIKIKNFLSTLHE